jgi:hypothetical protein
MTTEISYSIWLQQICTYLSKRNGVSVSEFLDISKIGIQDISQVKGL